ncbi:DUF3426 domain-containing protein [Pseudomonas fluorescens]|uniref:Zinc finger/thioredoxin putative domain-containing protein n=1 Tax=Pseudomonas fluorescens TaxID=294 RepID=A0A5E7CAQ8_PSEFL|nr:DUF3426 domain-containing protein [Pseudomonas fluorescens]VVO01436.1 hypothetical protein PS723_02670 [Pseudomonas fluorescens]
MTDSFVTQCPHCQTSFRVNHAQLSVARGAVRCGSCLQVFNAARQLLEQRASKETLPAGAPVPAEPVAPRAISQKQWTAAELDLDDLDEELARLEQREIQPITDLDQKRKPKEDSLNARREITGGEEEQWTGSLFSESTADRAETNEPIEPLANVDRLPADQIVEPDRPGRTEPSLSFELDDLRDEPEAPLIPLEQEPPAPEHFERLSAIDVADEELLEAEPPRKKRARSEPGLHDEVLQDLIDEPVQVDWQKRRSPWGRRFLWGLLILLGAAALAGQYIAYQFEELARQDQYRPWFQQLCPQIGCTVPSKVDIARIKSSNLVVRSHPDFSGALIVDAIIYNRAPFSQPFPLLELRFADLNGHLIASRRFKPGEYLNGELEGLAEMPPQTPIHIALDILDPGPKAVNYSLSFHSPE